MIKKKIEIEFDEHPESIVQEQAIGYLDGILDMAITTISKEFNVKKVTVDGNVYYLRTEEKK